MLMRLLRTHLLPYRGQIVVIVIAQFIATMASLYLPSLNGQIIDQGVAKGDTTFILTHGAITVPVALWTLLRTKFPRGQRDPALSSS